MHMRSWGSEGCSPWSRWSAVAAAVARAERRQREHRRHGRRHARQPGRAGRRVEATGTGWDGRAGRRRPAGRAAGARRRPVGRLARVVEQGAFTTSVPSGTKLTALTGGQATQFCSDLQKFFDNTFIPTICNSSANVAGAEAAYVDLIGNPSATDSELRAACTAASADAGPNGCTDALVDGGTGSCDSRRYRPPVRRRSVSTPRASTTPTGSPASSTPRSRAAALSPPPA